MPLLHYYLLLSSLTNLVFVGICTLLFYFAPEVKLDTLAAVIILIFLTLKSLLVGYLVHAAQKRGSIDQVTGTRFIGMYLGRFFGLILGVYIGDRIADLVGAIAGGVLLYFAGRWVGPEISKLIGHLLNHDQLAIDGAGTQAFQPLPSKRFLLAVYAAVFPILLVLVAVYIRATGITFDGFPTGWLPVARWVVIVISLYSLVLTWRFRRRMNNNPTPIPLIDMFWMGLALCVVPACYGFFLFTLGASIVELGIFAVLSSVAATYWSIKTNVVVS
jgi:hypothetical protein